LRITVNVSSDDLDKGKHMKIDIRRVTVRDLSGVAAAALLGACSAAPGSQGDPSAQSRPSAGTVAAATANTQSGARLSADPALSMADALPKGWVHMPGAIVREDCVHQVPDGATVYENGDVTVNGSVVAHYDACPEHIVRTTKPVEPSAEKLAQGGTAGAERSSATALFGAGQYYDGHWITMNGANEYGFDGSTGGMGVTKVDETWFVPSVPPSNGATTYMFSAVGSYDGNSVVQSVMQWGSDAWGGGNYYSLVSVGVNEGGYYVGPHSGAVTPYDQLEGVEYVSSDNLTQCANPNQGCSETWTILTNDTSRSGFNRNLSFNYSYTAQQTPSHVFHAVYVGVWEGYNISNCGQLWQDEAEQFYLKGMYYGYPNYTSINPNSSGHWISPTFQNPGGCNYASCIYGTNPFNGVITWDTGTDICP
jgi:hypothetical protein